MEPPKPYMPDRFLKRVQVIEDEKTTRVRYDIADFGEFRWMEARFGGWEQSKGLRFRVKVDIFGASKGGMFLFVYVIFDNDPWTGHWTAQLQCTFRLLSQDGKKDLVSLQKSYTIDHTNYYVVAGFPIEEIRKKGSGLIMSTGTVRLQIDILWEGIQISNSYEQLLQYKEEVKAKDLLAVKERKELLYLRNENRQLRTTLQKLNAERKNHVRRIDGICEEQKAVEALMTKLINATQMTQHLLEALNKRIFNDEQKIRLGGFPRSSTELFATVHGVMFSFRRELAAFSQELLISYDDDDGNAAQATENTSNWLPRRPARESDRRKVKNDETFH